MRTIPKISSLFAVVAAVLFTIETKAQAQEEQPLKPEYLRHWRIGYGLNLGIPFNNDYNFTLGADARLQYDITTKTSLAFTTGYTHLFSPDKDSGFIPAKLGFKSFLGNQYYVLGEAGAAFGVTKELGNSFLWAPGVGIATKHIDISLRYENYSGFDMGQISLRLAYGFSSKKINNYQNSKLKNKKTPR
ncbi:MULTISPECIES: hypothetical protein [Flavobacterium]|uniref:hypothetical protein n=1 Tax=Flavobacterium TaxID=237 RepID=UPI001FCAF517|nr:MULTISPECIES: hypothetical protein [Flavobacterium]UOK43898.1 hypothetical protein LZF87_07200 [Flavobacterium enshiense]